MIEFDDFTFVETGGSYEKVYKIMEKDSPSREWMLKSRVYAHTDTIIGVFVINFWNDGTIIIDDILRPMSTSIPNDDIALFCKWASDNGWKQPRPADKLMDSPAAFAFWEQQYRSGLVNCPAIAEREDELMRRLSGETKND